MAQRLAVQMHGVDHARAPRRGMEYDPASRSSAEL